MLTHTKFYINGSFYTQIFSSVSNEISLVLVKRTLGNNLSKYVKCFFQSFKKHLLEGRKETRYKMSVTI